MAPAAACNDIATVVEIHDYDELQMQLDAMSYSEPLGIESVPLVRHLIDDLIQETQAHEDTKIQIQELKKDAFELSQILLQLRKENAKILQENNHLQAEISHAEAYVMDKRSIGEVKEQDDDINKLQALQRLSMDSEETRRMHQQLNQHVQIVNDDPQEQLAVLMMENAKLWDQCDYLNDEAIKREQEISKLVQTTQDNGNVSDLQKKQMITQDGAHGGSSAVSTQEMTGLEKERQDYCRQTNELMLQVMQLKEELKRTKILLTETEREKEQLLMKVEAASKLQCKRENLPDVEMRKSFGYYNQLVESNEKVRELMEKQKQAQILLDRAEKAENENVALQDTSLALKRHVEELRDQIVSYKSRVETDSLHAKRLSDQIQKLQAEAAVASKKYIRLEKEKEELQNNYDNAMFELRNARQTWSHYQNEFEKLSNEVQAQHLSLSSGQDALQESQSSVSDLKNQVRQLQSELKLKQHTLHHLEMRLEQEKASHRSVQTQLMMLQDELLQTKETNRARDTALKQLRAEMQAKDRALTEKTEALENLKLLIEQVEASRDQMVFQAKQRQQQIQRHQQELNDLNAKVSSLNSEISAKNNEIISLKKVTRTLDAERDGVNDQLDALTEKYDEIEKEASELRKALEAYKSDAAVSQDQMSKLVNKLNESEDQLSKMKDHCSTLESEADRLEYLKGVHCRVGGTCTRFGKHDGREPSN